MRVATGTISHESSTFTPVPTDRRSYESRFGYLPQELDGIGQASQTWGSVRVRVVPTRVSPAASRRRKSSMPSKITRPAGIQNGQRGKDRRFCGRSLVLP